MMYLKKKWDLIYNTPPHNNGSKTGDQWCTSKGFKECYLGKNKIDKSLTTGCHNLPPKAKTNAWTFACGDKHGLKDGNDGSISCHEYCLKANYNGWSGRCLYSVENGQRKPCEYARNGGRPPAPGQGAIQCACVNDKVIREKEGNDGSVNCQHFCSDANYGKFSGGCSYSKEKVNGVDVYGPCGTARNQGVPPRPGAGAITCGCIKQSY